MYLTWSVCLAKKIVYRYTTQNEKIAKMEKKKKSLLEMYKFKISLD